MSIPLKIFVVFAALIVIYFEIYTSLYRESRDDIFKSIWIFIHKRKFKTSDFALVYYIERDDHLWNEGINCYMVAKPNGIYIEWDIVIFHKNFLIPYNLIDSICFSAYKKDIDFPFPPDNLNDFLDINKIFITDINNVIYEFSVDNQTAQKNLFRSGGNFYKAIYEKLPHEKIIVCKATEW